MLLTWQFYVKLTLFVAIIDGALRKWIMPSQANAIYFLKDGLLLVAYILFLLQSGRQRIMPVELRFLRPLLTLTILFLSMQVFNPALGSIAAGIIGFRHYMINLPLIFLVPRLFTRKEDLIHFLWLYALCMIPVGMLGVAQFFSPTSHWLNTYVGDDAMITSFGAERRARITGPFSYISGYTLYLTFIFSLLVTLATGIIQDQRKRWFLFAALFLCVANMLMTGSRSPVFGAAGFLVIYVWIQAIHSPAFFKKMLPSLIVAAIVFAVGIIKSPAYDSFKDRVESTTTLDDSRLSPTNQFENFFDFFRYDRPGGWGVGACHPATHALRNVFRLPPGEPYPPLEDETDRILAELGPIGFILWYSLRFGILVLLWTVFKKLRDPALRNLALMTLVLEMVTFPGQMVYHHTFSLYYWTLSGFIALLPRLQAREDMLAEQAAEEEGQELEYDEEPGEEIAEGYGGPKPHPAT